MKRSFSLIAALLMSGCVPQAALNAAPYLNLTPQKPPDTVVGYWTGAMGPYISTLAMNQDGTGTICYSWGEAQYTEGVKYDNGGVYINGSGQLAMSVDQNEMVLSGPARFTMKRDAELKNAVPYCRKQLKH